MSQPLDIRPKLLGLDAEVVLLAACFAITGGMLDHVLIGIILGVIATALWHRASTANVRGFAIHGAYWLFGTFRLSRTRLRAADASSADARPDPHFKP